ncbi:hypothetical protein CHGG_02802 [Chaetomium globosum CBS 148.51]|uniref:PH domain-containing protein n=1 Tax=Chaetomium globosum (strain ATCC 6205 / CBS 148.51 / DSM 1962 / NBRC 6347 / NRRL 1970) TaxID=306901 RepID=Q2HAF2_CHAGB|nr:uncharacterized protein CHGG_02802 [Chaetomium globosum CBS 148.51]EAQ90867.1 hypothetical protein CHGG_02802 [Chaetomium globosum CBS 148.51]
MAVNEQTLPELQPIFTLLNSHSNKLYQEGYFLKLEDQDIRGNPNSDRTWTECFAQLVGTVLSLWDAAELDAAGEDGEVLPKFINLTDASIKMIEALPTKTNDEQPLQNILSISTAGRNRYLLHFNSHHSLIQWTSGIRLAMYEHSTLQEAYTGALVAGKGKTLNNINIIMERARQPIQEWVRVRFGAGVPWKRCYCVIEPPSEKEYQKAQKEHKKRSPYDRSHGPVLKGEVRFFDTKKEADKKKKNQRPIASITDAYSAYAIYPQAKELIDSSTLLKVEGNITIHTEPVSATEGFVFVMPETPPAVSGFEVLLRFLFPIWDTFALYGRPGRLVASTLDTRSLMFAMPKNRRYGYLELLDVTGLIHTESSATWSEREWRKRLKDLTSQRMSAMEDAAGGDSRSTSRHSKRLSYGNQNSAARPKVGFADDGGSARSSRSMSVTRPGMRNDSAPPDPNRERAPSAMAGHSRHSRHISDTQLGDVPPSLSPDSSPTGQPVLRNGPDRVRAFATDLASTPERMSSEDDSPIRGPTAGNFEGMKPMQTPEPVQAPPAFAHGAGSRPQQKPTPSPEMRRATNRLSNTTLSQLARASGLGPEAFSDDRNELHYGSESAGPGPNITDRRGLAVQPQTSANAMGMNANVNGSREVLTSPTTAYPLRDASAPPPPLRDPARKRSNSPLRGPPSNPVGNPSPSFRPGPPGGRRTPPPGPNQHQPFSPPEGSPPINRKPLPVRTTSLSRDRHDAVSPISSQPSPRFPPPASGAQFRPMNDFTPPVPVNTRYHQNGQRTAGDRQDDASSTASPDYASTRRSIDTQESIDRPRAGVLKVVGDGGDGSGKAAADQEYDIPEINFGRTLNYSAPILPRDKPSPKETRPSPSTSDRKSPGLVGPFASTNPQSEENVRRSVVWPGPSAGTSSDNLASLQQSLQPRTSPVPQYAHQRVPSTNTLTDYKASHSRHSSADLLSSGRPLSQSHSRHSSMELLSSGRPASRGAAAAMSGGESHKRSGSRGGLLHSRNSSADLLASGRPNSQGTAAALSAGELSSSLSAREQEHVARVTGSPLIAFAGSKGPSQTQAGLVGAIDARERERAQMKQGFGGHAVAQAIDQRHREQSHAQRAAQAAYAQQQAQFAAQQGLARPQTPGNMNMMMGGPMSPSYGPQGQPRPQTPGSMMGGPMSPYGPQGQPRPQTPGSMMMGGGMQPRPQTPGTRNMMMDGGAPSPYGPNMAGMNTRNMSPGPNMMSPPGRYGQGPPQQRPPMGPHGASYGGGSPGQGGWHGGNMPPRQGPQGPMMPSPNMGFGMQGGRPQSPAYQLPPQNQYAPPGTPGGPRPGTPGTPGRMQYHGQAF